MPMTSPRASNPKKGKKIRNNTMAVAMICSSVSHLMAANDAPIVFPAQTCDARRRTGGHLESKFATL
jgi:hypothetical protein